MINTVIAIDPGRDKCGVAVVGKGDGMQWKQVIETSRLAAVVEELARTRGITTVVLGDRTAHRSAVDALAEVTVEGRCPSIRWTSTVPATRAAAATGMTTSPGVSCG